MKAHVFENSLVPLVVSLVFPVEAVTLGPLIFFKGAVSEDILRHELVHVEQYKEMYYVGLLALYIFYWVQGYFKYRDIVVAYIVNPFEMEARIAEEDPEYLCNRQPYAWRQWVGHTHQD